MSFSNITKNPKFVPVASSIGIHIFFILLSFLIHVSRPYAAPEEELLRFNVKSADMRPLLLKYTSPATNPDSKNPTRRFLKGSAQQKPSSPRDVSMEALAQPAAAQPKNAAEIKPKHVELKEDNDGKKPQMLEFLNETESSHSPDTIQIKQQSTSGVSDVAKMVEKHKTRPSDLVQSLARPLEMLGLGGKGNVNIDPEEGMPGFTPVEGTFGNSTFDQGGGVRESRGSILKYESLDEFLDIRVQTYADPKDSQKYFMIKIFAKKDAPGFKVMPKEILFLIDCSLSISPERLDEFKRGISASLKNLNKEDVFNIIAFRDKAFLFRPESVSASPGVIKQAENFVAGLTSNRTTDVYNAFEKIVSTKPARTPSNIILISDGRPTHGIVDSRELINSITRINNKVRPIFAYSGGSKVNRYLLDFISYQNRAWSQFVKERGKIHTGLADFYSKTKDPIFLNLRYRLNGLDEDTVFPKSLPDFYRNAEFTLYGTYKDENDFSMQLLGDIDSETKELIFTRALKDAEKGPADIMKGYAFNRIYHLISRVTREGQNPKLLNEIQELSKRYGITTPYSPDLETKD